LHLLEPLGIEVESKPSKSMMNISEAELECREHPDAPLVVDEAGEPELVAVVVEVVAADAVSLWVVPRKPIAKLQNRSTAIACWTPQ